MGSLSWDVADILIVVLNEQSSTTYEECMHALFKYWVLQLFEYCAH